MASAEWQLQKAIYATLRADAGVKAVVGDPARVYDHVPQSPTFPFIVIGEATALDESTMGTFGQVHTVDVDSWSRARGMKEVKGVQTAVQAALHRATLTVTGFVCAGIMQEFSQALRDPDGLTRHGVQRFRVVTLEA